MISSFGNSENGKKSQTSNVYINVYTKAINMCCLVDNTVQFKNDAL